MDERPLIYAEVVQELHELEAVERDRLLHWCIEELTPTQLVFARKAIAMILGDRLPGHEVT